MMNKFMQYPKTALIIYFMFICSLAAFSQNEPLIYVDKQGQLNYSLLDFWYARKVKESILLSGNIIELFGVGKIEPQSDFFDTRLKDEISPWSTTNIYAKMVLDIGNARVYPEKRGTGYCCRMETAIRKDNIVGLKVEVLIAGTLFVGDMIEPVRGMKDPLKNVNQGIPFTEKPKAIKFDYKYSVGKQRVKADYRVVPVEGIDKAEFCLVLQKRWEDTNGNVFATRIGGARQFFTGSVNQWINGAEFPIIYGDITNLPNYDAKTMGLINADMSVYVKNSQNKMVRLIETGWEKSDDRPTHLILYYTSSYEGVQYIGSPKTVFWVDNIELMY
jgi:hypothetical protein